ncbi:MAG: VWA domain-containing protein, partial [Acidobacteriaceae bacterium]|nr:VWA domain-containing protein [Acidobacteriaceae bacterium]
MKYRIFSSGLAAFGLVFVSLVIPGAYAQEQPETQSSDSVAKPKKPDKETPPAEEAPIPSEYKRTKEPDVPKDTPTFRSNATTVNVDVAVLDDHDRFIPQLPRDRFRVIEDGVPQQISQFGTGEAPMTICMVIEFSGRYQQFWTSGWYETLQASYGFLQTLKPDDNVAVVAYDLHTTILSDFSPDKNKAMEAMQRLRIPGFSESNVFDALTEIADRMTAIEGRKAILLISTGLDTFSKITFDQARKSLQESGVPIYSISILQVARMMAEARGMSGPREMDFLQADNEMR